MIDALWIAVSGVDYGQSEGDLFDDWTLDFIIDTHPCDDLPYVADIRPWPTAHIDGSGGRPQQDVGGPQRVDPPVPGDGACDHQGHRADGNLHDLGAADVGHGPDYIDGGDGRGRVGD